MKVWAVYKEADFDSFEMWNLYMTKDAADKSAEYLKEKGYEVYVDEINVYAEPHYE